MKSYFDLDSCTSLSSIEATEILGGGKISDLVVQGLTWIGDNFYKYYDPNTAMIN